MCSLLQNVEDVENVAYEEEILKEENNHHGEQQNDNIQ